MGVSLSDENYDYHVPIMLEAVLDALCVSSGGLYFDGTLGGAGHTRAILNQSSENRVIATDLDDDAISHAKSIIESSKGRLRVIKSNFKDCGDVFESLEIDTLDGALLDLGISSHQIDSAERGFSYRYDARLDMRMDKSQVLDAYTVINTYGQKQITDILKIYGEERFAKQIATRIIKTRENAPIETTGQLVDIIRQCIPYHLSNGHPAKKTFQALRIYINSELNGLDDALKQIIQYLKVGARLCVISFHSLEDRIVKNTFKDLSRGCICDKRLPICVCGNTPSIKVLDKIIPTDTEIENNNRAKSAILRVCEKLK